MKKPKRGKQSISQADFQARERGERWTERGLGPAGQDARVQMRSGPPGQDGKVKVIGSRCIYHVATSTSMGVGGKDKVQGPRARIHEAEAISRG